MNTLQEAARNAIKLLEELRGISYLKYEHTAIENSAKELRTALAQQGEPVAQARLGMKDGLAMALSVVELYGMKGDVIYREIAKLRDGIAAAPAPQAQDKSDNYLSGYCTGRTDLLKEQSAQPVAQPLSDSEIEKLREKTFSTYNPYCPVDSKSMRKAVRAAEAAHGIGEVK